ncbi:pitrilysin family protein [Shewanella sp. CG12_big_fil_rev_8_21_14_0_65_47_15]|uniref:M16 family metallopeptidase n=1 Tax=Shewanella sp. CG12_big_fil_rev_8_21_14_0_65_47_15 TaxID=1975537 RepID=UPI000CA7BF6A|nr:pitrilysin family protein [Shewanella sp. CG12_big_fil_rev_8_21_14_0_65_47_15]PIW61981.1 MAG: insulinase family protein [Shewanella sp. CG12_big_fil_rev_8_21_14_0_65_47_15]
MKTQVSFYIAFIASIFSPALKAQCHVVGAQTLYQLESRIETYTLANGLRVRLLPLEDKQTLTIASQFNVGARNEAKGQSGYAHLFEHMLFKGSENAPGDTYAQQFSALGARFNASTHFDYTNYFVTLPSQALELALYLEADRFIRPSLNATTVKNQQETVLQEMAQTIDNQPYVRSAMEFLLDQVQGTPYGHGIIGSREDILQATPESLTAFHRAYYRPDAMQLSLVGKLSPQTRQWIEQNFATWPKPTTTEPRFTELNIEPKQVHAELVDERGPWSGLLLAWHTVGKDHPDAAAIRLLEAHLFQNTASALAKISQHNPDQMLSYSLPFELENHGIANIVLVPRARTSLDTLVEKVQGLIAQTQQQALDETRLCTLKQVWLNNRLQQLSDTQALATQLSATSVQDTDHPLTAPWQRINAVTAEEFQRVAKQYFNQDYVRVDLLPPWYIRWGKTLLEWLPDGASDSLEEAVL